MSIRQSPSMAHQTTCLEAMIQILREKSNDPNPLEAPTNTGQTCIIGGISGDPEIMSSRRLIPDLGGHPGIARRKYVGCEGGSRRLPTCSIDADNLSNQRSACGEGGIRERSNTVILEPWEPDDRC